MSAKFAKQKYRPQPETPDQDDAQRDSEYHPVLILGAPTASPPPAPDRLRREHLRNGAGEVLPALFFMQRFEHATYATKAVDTTQWHNYVVEWTPTGITGYIDGVKTFTDTNPAHQPLRQHAPDPSALNCAP